MTVLEHLRDKANSLPVCPGVYIMKDADGRIIYVGKSKALKHRVTSYFTGNQHTVKTARMVSLVRDFDYILCKTEIEALALENVLIKKHSPKYNIKLKDAKSYPYIKVTAEEYPRLIVTRERKSDKGKYYGPYSGTGPAYGALDTVRKIFSLPTCKRVFPRDIGRDRPCLYRDMGRCIAPCAGGVSPEEYAARVRSAERVLDGGTAEAIAELTEKMNAAAEDLEFERAAALRDSIAALNKLSEKQKVVADGKVSRDVFSLYTSETEGVLAMLTVRGGALVNKSEFILSSSELTSPEDALPLIVDHYDTGRNYPKEVLLDFAPAEEDADLLSEYLSLEAGRKVTVRIPERGDGLALCRMAHKNAEEAARQFRLESERENKALRKLSEMLGLHEIPRRIESYDISNLGNESITASMVVCKDGKMKKSDYRTFLVKTTGGADDYGAMREVLSRRLAHIGDGSASLGEEPDLILLDGGAGQVHAVAEVMAGMDLSIPLFGMVKDDYHKTRAITDGEREISIAKEQMVYTFVYTIQEEVHRFAVKSTMNNKIRTMTHSSLEKIPGIGPKKAKILLATMSLSEIRTKSAEELSAVRGISAKDAEAICAYYRKNAGKSGGKNQKEKKKG